MFFPSIFLDTARYVGLVSLCYALLFIPGKRNPGLNGQASEVIYWTTPDKVTMSYKEGGSTLNGVISTGDKFAMNGQMYTSPGRKPVGLYIENRKIKHSLKLVDNDKVNFGINPQAVFYIDTNGKAGIADAKKIDTRAYQWATQLAPMLLQEGTINPKIKNFKGLCKNRNGVGITREGKIVFIFAPQPTTLPELAAMFSKQGCITAAYIDGFVSDYWSPGRTTEGSYGVVIRSR